MGAPAVPIGDLISMLRKGTVTGSKSTALTPLLWAIGIMASTTAGAARAGAPNWLLAIFGSCLLLTIVGLLVAYGYLMVNDRDALRTERYTLTKLAIEQYMSGDDQAGLALVELAATDNEGRKGPAELPAPESRPKKPKTPKSNTPPGGPAS